MSWAPPYILGPADPADAGFLGHLTASQQSALKTLRESLARGGLPRRAPGAASPEASADETVTEANALEASTDKTVAEDSALEVRA